MNPIDFYTIGDLLVKRPEYNSTWSPNGHGPFEVIRFNYKGHMILRDLHSGEKKGDDECGFVGAYLQLKSTGEHP